MGTFVDQVSVSSQTELSWLRYIHWLQMKSSKSRAALQKKLQFGKLPFNFFHIICRVLVYRHNFINLVITEMLLYKNSCRMFMLKVVFIYLFNMNIVHEYTQKEKKERKID